MSLHRDWAMLGDRLAQWSPTIDSAPPGGERRLTYVRHGLVPERQGLPGGGVAGRLELDIAGAKGGVRLRARESIAAGFTTMETVAEIEADASELLTPRSWTLAIRWTCRAPAGGCAEELDQTASARADDSQIVWSLPARRRCPAPLRWTCFWSLVAAAARWPRRSGSALEFDLLEDLDQWKPSQRIVFAGATEVSVAGRERRFGVFEQTGRGVMPWRWWVEEGGVVWLAAGGRKAYLLDSANDGRSS